PARLWDASDSFTLIRANVDGTPDTLFSTASGVGAWMRELGLQTDGKILVAVGPSLSRLLPDGSADTNYNPEAPISRYSPLVIQPDGKLLAGGETNLMRFLPTAPVVQELLY